MNNQNKHKLVSLVLAISIMLAAYVCTDRANASPLEQGSNYTIHSVHHGETLYLIARQYGVTVDQIVQANNLYNVNRIYVGQQLIIPRNNTQSYLSPVQPTRVPQSRLPSAPSKNFGGQYYTVQRGDTLASIAYRFGTTASRLAQANGIVNHSFLYVGQSLFIPVATTTSYTYTAPTPVPTYPQLIQPTPLYRQEIYYSVRAGDTLAGIAYRFGTTVSAIVQANNIPNSRYIYVGQSLIIPR